MNNITFESIEQSVGTLDLDVLGAPAAFPGPVGDIQRLLALYRGVRPILTAVAALPLLPPQFREPVRLFLATLDRFAQGVSGTHGGFRAGGEG